MCSAKLKKGKVHPVRLYGVASGLRGQTYTLHFPQKCEKLDSFCVEHSKDPLCLPARMKDVTAAFSRTSATFQWAWNRDFTGMNLFLANRSRRRMSSVPRPSMSVCLRSLGPNAASRIGGAPPAFPPQRRHCDPGRRHHRSAPCAPGPERPKDETPSSPGEPATGRTRASD